MCSGVLHISSNVISVHFLHDIMSYMHLFSQRFFVFFTNLLLVISTHFVSFHS